MGKIQSLTALLIALSTAVCLAQSEQHTRSIVMDLNLPNGAAPRLRVADGGLGTVDISKVGKFGFVARIHPDGNTVAVEVYNLKTTPHERMASVEAAVGGDMVQTNTKPQFGIRIVRIMTP